MSYQNAFSLEGETALITGGGSGLGFGMAQCFIQAGAEVILAGRNEATLSEAVEQLGEGARYIVHDVTELDKADELIEQAGDVSILVNNAGVHLKMPAVDTTPEEFNTVMQTHVNAAQALSRAALPRMLERKHGSILFTASMTAIMGMPSVIAYSAAKSALVGMTRALTAEVASEGVRVNAIAPGWIESPMLRKAISGDEERTNKILSRTPMKRFGDPEDIGWAAVYLCSPAAKFVSGVLLPVDGGAAIGF
ncbi:SDR family NAD(P)-dependent oxidoreductase [Coraliomargarita akajimensis]|uniref:Short-chain dehydrogenase/reductase SDR n=1 Tax=Coraliomargarita akajimensis (strain DSM 45221 / IAM 15411 / JCM 23193 / KCTC 12865 / 04OKA010-24) TaxID=583355 RepID=D5ENA9_CORAD|nr:glucose 1-dehydrogenase [Coraliomargarita akajimensis]ADE53544.1 short-chain dehydrogenase/reductase SDR [Coraliomargarita akajimensis DSM 45221]